MSDDEFEPIRGLPKRLPAGENILWQGEPDWRRLAWRALHVREASAYFSVILCWAAVGNLSQGTVGIMSELRLVGLAAASLTVLGVIGWLSARATVYTLTDKRLVIRSGIAFPLVVTIPYTLVVNAAVKRLGDGSGDLVLALGDKARPSYLALWPNARPWRLARPEPMLRCLRDVAEPAEILARALAVQPLPLRQAA